MESTVDKPLVVLLAGLSGTGKSTFAPYLAKELGGTVLDTDNFFDIPRIAVGNALGIGTKIVDYPAWRTTVHGRLISLFLAMVSVAATHEHPVVAVSPWTGFRENLNSFDKACVGLDADFRWVVAKCEPETRYERICKRARPMDSLKVSAGVVPDPKLAIPPKSIFIRERRKTPSVRAGMDRRILSWISPYWLRLSDPQPII